MKSLKLLMVLLTCAAMLSTSCDTLNTLTLPTGPTEPTEGDMISGLKEALQVGTLNAVKLLNKQDGYLGDPLVKIPFPPDAQRAADKLRDIGMGNLVDNFVTTLNRGAENAAEKAGPIFVDAVKQMTLADAKNILLGADNAATQYFKDKTSTALFAAFQPPIKTALDNVGCTKYWTDVTTTYNKIPLVNKVETDLPKYATTKAMDGLFLKLADEEKKIRQDPVARVSDMLKKVFGWASQQKKS